MSPRRPAALRDGGQDLRQHLIAAAAALIGERGTAGLAVRDIARAAHVADGVLYNYFEDKEDLLAHALLAHVAAVMSAGPRLPPPGTGTLAENLEAFIVAGLDVLTSVTPAFAGLVSQHRVLNRFYSMVGGGAAFGSDAEDERAHGPAHHPGRGRERGPGPDPGRPDQPDDAGSGGRSLPEMLTRYLRGEQRLGRVDPEVDVDAASKLVVGAIHGEILPPVFFSPPGTRVTVPPDLAGRLTRAVLRGIAPREPAG